MGQAQRSSVRGGAKCRISLRVVEIIKTFSGAQITVLFLKQFCQSYIYPDNIQWVAGIQ